MDKQLINKNNYIFDGIKSKKAQDKIIRLLKSCKEIRDTAYPLDDSQITQLSIMDLHAHKQKDYIYVIGTLLLQDDDKYEKRSFEAYITSKEKEDHVLLDITRLDVNAKTTMIRTTDVIKEEKNNLILQTSYCGLGYFQDKKFLEKFPLNEDIFDVNAQQLSVL